MLEAWLGRKRNARVFRVFGGMQQELLAHADTYRGNNYVVLEKCGLGNEDSRRQSEAKLQAPWMKIAVRESENDELTSFDRKLCPFV